MLGFHQSRGCQKFKISRQRSEIDTEEVFIDALVYKGERSEYQTIELALSERIVHIVFAFFLIIIGIFLVRCFYLQIITHDIYAKAAERNRYIGSEVDAQRGIVYDRNLKQLVSNSQSFDLNCDFSNLPEDSFAREKEIRELSAILDIPFDDLMTDISDNENSGASVYAVVRGLSEDKVIVLKTKENDLLGFEVVKKDKRDYLSGANFAHVLGYVSGDDSTGQSGIEKQYEDYLKETPGIMNKEKDAQGNIIKEEMVKSAQSGNNLVLNIDYDLQQDLAESLAATIKGYKAKGGSAVAVNPQNGEVLSLVSLPSFDNNIFSENLTSKEFNKLISSPDVSFYNRVIAGEYPIASTIKPMIAVAALENKLISPTQQIYCPEAIELNDGTLKKDWAFHGWTDLKKAIAESVDTYFYMIAGGYKDFVGLGVAKIDPYLKSFGFGEKTGIDLPQETEGLLPDPKWKKENIGLEWYPGDTYNISIGQGYFKATPLQLTMAVSAIANGGKVMKPEIVKSIIDENGKEIQTFVPEILNENFASAQTINSVKEAMSETVLSSAGTARSLQSLPVSSGAKTGTAQTGKNLIYHNWITVFAPYENPQIVLTVMLESVPNSTGIANIVAREVLKNYFGTKPSDEANQEVVDSGR